MGKWRVADALATLAFDYPPRADYFRSELEAFLLFTREAKLDPLEVRGSYAGAIGIPQFMPNSYRRWAVDFDGDGVALLRSSPVDAIGSVANFLKSHGWVAGEPIWYPASLGSADPAPLLAEGIKPTRTLEDLTAMGVSISATPPARPGTLGALIDLVTPDSPTEYRVGLENFYVLTRYNRSSFYASAVSDLAQALRQSMTR
jgi:membrane-bound lytic murein transglycosylase B